MNIWLFRFLFLMLSVLIFGPGMLIIFPFGFTLIYMLDRFWPWDYNGNPKKRDIVIKRNKRDWED